jgi:hypothetical protein
MAIGDFLNGILPPAEERGGSAAYAHETLTHRYGDLALAVRNVLEVIPPAPETPQPEAAPVVSNLHTEIARSAIRPVETEAVETPVTAQDPAEDKRIDNLMADIFAIHDEHSLEVARQLEAERRMQGGDDELAA